MRQEERSILYSKSHLQRKKKNYAGVEEKDMTTENKGNESSLKAVVSCDLELCYVRKKNVLYCQVCI